MQHVLRPAIHAAGNQSEQILHAQGRARPVVGFELGHRHQQIAPEHRIGKIQRFSLDLGARNATRVTSSRLRSVKTVSNLGRCRSIRRHRPDRGSRGDDRDPRQCAHRRLQRRGKLPARRAPAWGCVDDGVRVEFHQIGLQYNALAGHVQAVLRQDPTHQTVEIFRIPAGTVNGNRRPGCRPVPLRCPQP